MEHLILLYTPTVSCTVPSPGPGCYIGVSPYLGFTLYLSTLLMFELNEAVRGRLIGPKSWDRIVIILETSNGQPV